jgi:hypothetical protein
MTRPLYRLPDDIDKEFRLFISETHDGQFKKGLLMEELVNAVKFYMVSKRSFQNTHTHAQDPVYRLLEEIKQYLLNSSAYVDIPRFIHSKHLIGAINAIKGTDKRTFEKYEKLLIDSGYIRKSGLHEYEFIGEKIENK